MCRSVLTLIIADSRTGYGGEKRTYSSTTGTYGSGGTGSKFASAMQTFRLLSSSDRHYFQATPFERNCLFLTSHLSLSIWVTCPSMQPAEMSRTFSTDVTALTSELSRTKWR
jgi:hypothetical protein